MHLRGSRAVRCVTAVPLKLYIYIYVCIIAGGHYQPTQSIFKRGFVGSRKQCCCPVCETLALTPRRLLGL